MPPCHQTLGDVSDLTLALHGSSPVQKVTHLSVLYGDTPHAFNAEAARA